MYQKPIHIPNWEPKLRLSNFANRQQKHLASYNFFHHSQYFPTVLKKSKTFFN